MLRNELSSIWGKGHWRMSRILVSPKFWGFMKIFFFGKREGRKEGGRRIRKEKKYDQLNITFTTAINNNNNFWFFVLVCDRTAFCNSLKLQQWNNTKRKIHHVLWSYVYSGINSNGLESPEQREKAEKSILLEYSSPKHFQNTLE